MKLLIFSDIHGSSYYANKLKEIVSNENPDKIVLLGDLYYHGPRNNLSQEYAPMEVAKVLNELKDKLMVVRGNCDAEVDEMISEFKFEDHIFDTINGKRVYFTHGHKYNIENIPYDDFEVLIYGHIHQGFIEKKEGFVFGVAAKMFTIAGPVLVYGIGTSVIIGLVYYVLGLMGIV